MILARLTLVVFLICTFDARSWGATISLHQGANDPITEGFVATGSILSSGPLAPDGATGLDAWKVAAAGNPGYYQDSLSGPEISDAATNGWKLTAMMRMPAVGSFTFASYWTGTVRWDLLFSSTAGADRVELFNGSVGSGPSFLIPGPINQYHLFEYVFTTSAASADLFVDGVERISNFGGRAAVTPASVDFGSQGAQGNFNLVRFETPPFLAASAPEPATYLLMGSAVVILPLHRMARDRKKPVRVSRSARFE